MNEQERNEKRINGGYRKYYDEGYEDGYQAAIDDASRFLKKLVIEQQKAVLMTGQKNALSWQWAQKELKRLQQAVIYFTMMK